ncbi:MAG: DUF1127 domain-containing protein [Rhodobacteraceae bacterium]|nr:MAG: DUF1127 domain-containing protein [Paracoccaceae bacterium]
MSTNTQAANSSVFGLIASAFRSIGEALIAASPGNARLLQVEALNRLSDAELARRGLRREDIVRRVFSDIYYI